MDREKSALLASWLTFAVSVATLVVTVAGVAVGAVALLSIDQVKRVVCRELTYDCGFDAVVVHLLTVDAEARDPSQPPPPQLSELAPFPDFGPPPPARAWKLLVQEADAAGGTDAEDMLLGSPDRSSKECLALPAIASLFDASDKTADLFGAQTKWRVTYVSDAIDEGLVAPKRDVLRSVGFELVARYGLIHKDKRIVIHVLTARNGFFASVYPTDDLVYDVTLPEGSVRADVLCPLPDQPVGENSVRVETHSDQGDWDKTDIPPMQLDVRSLTPEPPAPPDRSGL